MVYDFAGINTMSIHWKGEDRGLWSTFQQNQPLMCRLIFEFPSCQKELRHIFKTGLVSQMLNRAL